MLNLGIRKIEAFVNTQQELGNDIKWNGWTLEFFRPSDQAIYNAKDGVFRSGQWGYLNQVEVNEQGLWSIDYRNIKRDKRGRN